MWSVNMLNLVEVMNELSYDAMQWIKKKKKHVGPCKSIVNWL